MRKRIDDPHKFLYDLGGLHDARIERVLWLPENKCLEISVDDINSNFEGLPEYKGCQPSTISLEEVVEINFNITNVEDHINIDEFVVEAFNDTMLLAKLKCWPSGSIKVKFLSLQLSD